MKLNLEIIGDRLPDSFHPRLDGKTDETLSLGRPRMYEPGSVLEPGKLYITHGQSLPKSPPVAGAAFICDGRISQEWAVSGNQFLLLSNCPGTKQLLNMVQEICDGFDALDNAIISELAKGRGFDFSRIVSYGSEMLENPLSVTDSELNIRISTDISRENDAVTYNTSYSEGLKGPKNLDRYTMVKDACLLERELRIPYVSTVQHNGNRMYCYNLYYMDVFIGCAWLAEENKKFRKSDFQLANHIFKYLQQASVTYPSSAIPTDSAAKNALCNLLEHSEPSPGAYEEFQLLPGEAWQLLRLRDLPNRNAMPKDYMLASLNVLIKQMACSTVFNHDIIGLMRLQKGKSTGGDATLGLLKSILQRMDYVCGVSNEFNDIAQLDNAYLEAGFALEHLFRTGHEPATCSFQDCILEFMLSRMNGELPLSELYSENLAKLCEYDRSHNTDYLRTLNVYLATEMNATLAAKLLFIHRSSFLKRLEKITNLLGDDLDDPRKRMYYRLMFSAWDRHGDERMD